MWLRDRIINRFDIDARRLTVAGWLVSVASVSVGFLAAVAAYMAVAGRIAVNEGPALAFGVGMIGGTVIVFISLRAVLSVFGVEVVKDRDETADS
jgi:hypothetical protein